MILRKPRIVLKLQRRSHLSLVTLALRVIQGIEGNALYPSPVPALSEIKALANALKSSIVACGPTGRRGSTKDRTLLLANRKLLHNALTMLATYCSMTTPYDADAFISAGWEVRRERFPRNSEEAPGYPRQVFQKNIPQGTVKVRCNKVEGAKSYIFRREPQPPETQPVQYFSTKTYCLIKGLIRGEVYRFRVAAIGSKGVGAFSGVFYVRVL